LRYISLQKIEKFKLNFLALWTLASTNLVVVIVVNTLNTPLRRSKPNSSALATSCIGLFVGR